MARLVIRERIQIERLYHIETCSPGDGFTSIHTVLALSVKLRYYANQRNVKLALPRGLKAASRNSACEIGIDKFIFNLNLNLI